MLRIKGEYLLGAEHPDAAQAEVVFNESLRVARDHRAKSWELRAAMSLTKLWQSQHTEARAREVLIPVFEWFTEGHDSVDLRAAKALVESIS